jgi:hypothetical protein
VIDLRTIRSLLAGTKQFTFSGGNTARTPA